MFLRDFLQLSFQDLHRTGAKLFHALFQFPQLFLFFPFLFHILEQLHITFHGVLEILIAQQTPGFCRSSRIFFLTFIQLLQTCLKFLLAPAHTLFPDKSPSGIVIRVQTAQLKVLVQQAVSGNPYFTPAQLLHILTFDHISEEEMEKGLHIGFPAVNFLRQGIFTHWMF